MASNPNSKDPSRSSTPNPRFVSTNATAEEVFKSQTVGLVNLSDFRKRRAEALDSHGGSLTCSGASTPAAL
jgi:protein FAM50